MCPSKALMIIHSDSSVVSQKSNLVIFIYNCVDCSWIVWQIHIYIHTRIVHMLVDSGHWLTTKVCYQGMFILSTGYLPGTAVIGSK